MLQSMRLQRIRYDLVTENKNNVDENVSSPRHVMGEIKGNEKWPEPLVERRRLRMSWLGEERHCDLL